MRLHFDIKPKQFVIQNHPRDMVRFRAGMEAIYKVFRGAYFSVGGNGKTNWSAYTDLDSKNIYAYNVEYRKRGKYKNNKHCVVYAYTFSIEVLKILGLSIEQNPYNFKLYKFDRHGKKIYL